MFRSAIARSSVAHARPFHSTSVAQKTVTEKVSEVAKDLNLKAGRKLAGAIETGEEAAAATKDTMKSATQEGKEKAGEAATVAGQKKNEAAAGAREMKDDLQKKASK
ncbi:hypothetical protein B0H17DRAFT_1330335 [Mycena rosella]|uniref:LEA domain protein n=1 Tax=Mycena rosella TaxID=1033263 RepID=A0AAD7DMA4_MYCRO|nr:hypothetical protein B0H17DRAFT_1330335 [Mycena rosella]